MSELDGTRTISISSLAFNYVNNRLESIGYQGELYARERGAHVAHYGTRWHELFGTPEKAARTLLDVCDNCGQDECSGCQVYELTRGGDLDYDALLEWLRGVSDGE